VKLEWGLKITDLTELIDAHPKEYGPVGRASWTSGPVVANNIQEDARFVTNLFRLRTTLDFLQYAMTTP